VNIYPAGGENVLVTHPKVIDVACSACRTRTSAKRSRRSSSRSTCRRRGRGAALERELIAYCKTQLADVKCPRSVDFRDELPRHPTGKLYKRLCNLRSTRSVVSCRRGRHNEGSRRTVRGLRPPRDCPSRGCARWVYGDEQPARFEVRPSHGEMFWGSAHDARIRDFS
jgi:hypothetical protein